MAIANYGYADGSGEWYIVIDTDKCDGCGKCVEACPQGILEVVRDDYDELVVVVKEEYRRGIKYTCMSCQVEAGKRRRRLCSEACPVEAITQSW